MSYLSLLDTASGAGDGAKGEGPVEAGPYEINELNELSPEVDIETEAVARAGEILIIARRLRHIRTLPIPEAEQLLDAYKSKVAAWRVFAEAHYAETEAIGDLHDRMLDEVAALRRQLQEARAPPEGTPAT
jgi:hypothetical protein